MSTPKSPARSIMTTNMVTIPLETTLSAAAALLQKHRITGAPVTDNTGKIVGLLSQTDLVRYWMKSHDSVHSTGDARKEERPLEAPEKRPSDGYSELEEIDGKLLAERFLEEDLGDASVADAYTPYVIFANADDSIQFVASLMTARSVHRVVILDAGKPAGLVTAFGVMNSLAGAAEDYANPALRAI